MALGPDGQLSEEARAWAAGRRTEDKARAALVTGSKKNFNDAALLVEQLADDVRNVDFYGQWNEVKVDADLSSIEKQATRLPSDGAGICRAVIEATRAFRETEQEVAGARKGLTLPSLQRIAADMDVIFRMAGTRGKFYDSLESSRQRLESRALSL